MVCEEEDLRELKEKLPRTMKFMGAPAGLTVAARLQMSAEKADGEILRLVDATIVPVSDGCLEEIVSPSGAKGWALPAARSVPVRGASPARATWPTRARP